MADATVEQGDQNDPLLNEDEIDSLLKDGESGNGLRSLIDTSHVTYERLPMLEVIFDCLVRLLTTSIRNFTSGNVEITIAEAKSVRLGDYLDSLPLPAMLNVFKAKEWNNSALLSISTPLIFSLVDSLLGGRTDTSVAEVEGRDFTSIERNLMERFTNVILEDFTASFEPISKVTFEFDRLETNPGFAVIDRPGNAAILMQLKIDMEGRGGMVEFVIPYGTLEPAREKLLQMFMGEKFGQDNIWETHFNEELWKTEIRTEAVLDEITLSLNDVLKWKKGTNVLLNAQPDDDIKLRCGPLNIFTGKIGNRKGRVAIKVDKNHIKGTA